MSSTDGCARAHTYVCNVNASMHCTALQRARVGFQWARLEVGRFGLRARACTHAHWSLRRKRGEGEREREFLLLLPTKELLLPSPLPNKFRLSKKCLDFCMRIICWNVDAPLTSKASIDADVNNDGKLMHASRWSGCWWWWCVFCEEICRWRCFWSEDIGFLFLILVFFFFAWCWSLIFSSKLVWAHPSSNFSGTCS